MPKLFGTDGPRGIAVTDLTCELAMQTGRAAAVVLAKKGGEKAKIIIGKDTRASSDALEAAVCAGVCSVGADAELVGVVPTPAVAFLVKEYGASAGIMISGSHNSAEFNGIKVFSSAGRKLTEDEEEKIEHLVMEAPHEIKLCPFEDVGRVNHDDKALDAYIEHIEKAVGADLDGIRVALDCANGCAAYTAERIFSDLGADVTAISVSPDGTNINKNCGSTNIQELMDFVTDNGFDCGLAFDGDADRCIAVDDTGDMIDGDKLMAIFMKAYKGNDLLDKNTAVVTAMSNHGLFRYARENGITLGTSGSGDRYILERMLEGGYKLGGEQSGHIIFLDDTSTGDGQLTGARLLSLMKEKKLKLSELAGEMHKLPQVILNVRIPAESREMWKNDREITDCIERQEQALGAEGRIIVRESGTEPIIRVMVEGSDFVAINGMAVETATLIKHRCSLLNNN